MTLTAHPASMEERPKMPRQRGAISRLFKGHGVGYIVGPGPWEIPFAESGLNGILIDTLSPGQTVEYELSPLSGAIAVEIKPVG